MPIIDGKKYACEACIRGHRVSGCQHGDREMLEVAKKGRPVTQCTHCREMRKLRSAHSKCECAALKEAAKLKAQQRADKKSPSSSDELSSDSSACQCQAGTQCICSVKREILDPVPEQLEGFPSQFSNEAFAVTDALGPVSRPNLQSTQSESAITTFTNGHHRPARHHPANHGGAPYTIPSHAQNHPQSTGATLEGLTLYPTSFATSAHSIASLASSSTPSLPLHRQVHSEASSPAIPPKSRGPKVPITPLDLSGTRLSNFQRQPVDYTAMQQLSPSLNESPYASGGQFARSSDRFYLAPESDSVPNSCGLYPSQGSQWPGGYAQDSYEQTPVETPLLPQFPIHGEQIENLVFFNNGNGANVAPALTNSSSRDPSEAGEFAPSSGQISNIALQSQDPRSPIDSEFGSPYRQSARAGLTAAPEMYKEIPTEPLSYSSYPGSTYASHQDLPSLVNDSGLAPYELFAQPANLDGTDMAFNAFAADQLLLQAGMMRSNGSLVPSTTTNAEVVPGESWFANGSMEVKQDMTIDDQSSAPAITMPVNTPLSDEAWNAGM